MMIISLMKVERILLMLSVVVAIKRMKRTSLLSRI